MANLKEQDKWEEGVYQIEENDPVLGGEDGITNKPIKQLANRTLWLKKALELFGKKSAPKDLTAESVSTADETGHSHKLPQGSISQKGIWQATSDTGVDSENLVLTARAGKKLAQLIATVQIALNNYIPTKNRSSAVNSNDENNVATSKAVKTAYEKGVEAKSAADKAQSTANDGVSKANSANDNANGRVSKNGDVMSGDLGIKSGDYSGVNLFNLEGGRVRLESLEHENSAFFSKLSYILGSDFLDSILFPKSGINQVVAYQDWVNAVIAGLIKRYNGAGHAWYGQHYLGCDVYRIPFSDSAGLKIQLMKGDWWDGNWIVTPEVFDGYWFALGVDIGGGRDSIGFTFKDRNMMQIHTDHQTVAHILAIGWYSY